jgi:VIT1/CCC1 family predicted Fe2+/Mn2+ transporter
MIYFVVGLCLGMTVMAIICEEAHKEQLSELRKQIEKDSKYYYDAVSKLEDEIMTQRNVVKALNDDNVRLRKKLKSKDND